MSNRAWMPLHIDDYIRDTDHLSATEHGAYLLLIMKYWRDGGLPADEELIRRYAKLSPEQWAESRAVLAAFFDEGWRHKRIDEELAKAAGIIEKRKAAGRQTQFAGKCSANAGQMPEHMPSTSSAPITNNLSSSLRSDEKRAREAEFEETFWPRYPNKVGKPKAREEFHKARKRASLETIMAGLDRYVAKTDDRAWCNPATWLHQDRWDDQPALPPARGSPSPKPPTAFDVSAHLLAEMRARHAEPGTSDGRNQQAALLLPDRQRAG